MGVRRKNCNRVTLGPRAGETRLRTRVAADRLLSALLEVEALDGHWVVIVPSSIDDRPTASLAQDVVLILCVGQQSPVQK